MRKINKIIALAIIAATFFVSCKKDEPTEITPISTAKNIAYVVNYGTYPGLNSEISIYDIDNKSIVHDNYKKANDIDFASNIQSMAINNDIAYLMSNDGDKIDIINAKTLKASINPISTDIVKPRFFVANGNTAYISCWGNADWNLMEDSYIAKIDLTTKSVTKIALPGGPEGLAIANNKLYAALNYRDSIAVINLTSDAISYIATPAVSSYLLKDNSENLYVSFVSTYSDPSLASGIGYINTNTDVIESNTLLDGISSNYGSIMQFNSDKSKIYIIAAAYDANWVLQGGVHVFNTSTKSYETPVVENLAGINGVAVNPQNNNIYVLLAPSATEKGTMKIYNTAGTIVDEQETGISPCQVMFYKVD